jgi:hypothetical protein
MEHHTKLKSFKSLLKESLSFYKTNWQKLFKVLLPIEVAIFASSIILDFIYESDSHTFIYVGIFFSILSLVALLFRSLFLMTAPRVVSDMDNEVHHTSNKFWYKKALRDILPVAWIMVIVAFIDGAFMLTAAFVSMLIFAIPALVTGILIRLGLGGFAINTYDFFVTDITTVIVLVSLFVLSIIGSIVFIAHSFFSLYVFVLEGRKGLDAVVNSFMLVAQNRAKIFWRIAGVWSISSIPFLIFTLPVYLKIVINGLQSMAIEIFVLHITPSIPPTELGLAILRDTSIFVSSIIGSTIFMVLGYILWKDVRGIATNFEENNYTTTKRWLKRGIYAGSIIMVLTIIVIIAL